MIWFIVNSWYLNSHILWNSTNNELPKTKSSLLQKRNRTRPLWTCCHTVINWAIQYHILQVFLFNDTLFNMYDWLTVNLQPTVLDSCLNETLLYSFPLGDTHPSLSSGTLNSTLQHYSWEPFKQWHTKGKAQIYFKCGIHHEKYICLQHRNQNKTADHCLVWPQLGKHVQETPMFHHSEHHMSLWMTVKAPHSTDFFFFITDKYSKYVTL